jgi:prepilin-type N-terminal cleavage/methylation domain-containing protein
MSGTGRGSPGRCSVFSRGRHLGYTLLEVIVVLVLFAVVATAVAPSLLSLRREQSSALYAVVGNARDAAVRRGEMVRLRVDRSGAWHASAGVTPQGELLMSGRLSDIREALDLLFSPLGTCALTPEAIPAQALAAIDPLTCEIRSR